MEEAGQVKGDMEKEKVEQRGNPALAMPIDSASAAGGRMSEDTPLMETEIENKDIVYDEVLRIIDEDILIFETGDTDDEDEDNDIMEIPNSKGNNDTHPVSPSQDDVIVLDESSDFTKKRQESSSEAEQRKKTRWNTQKENVYAKDKDTKTQPKNTTEKKANQRLLDGLTGQGLYTRESRSGQGQVRHAAAHIKAKRARNRRAKKRDYGLNSKLPAPGYGHPPGVFPYPGPYPPYPGPNLGFYSGSVFDVPSHGFGHVGGVPGPYGSSNPPPVMGHGGGFEEGDMYDYSNLSGMEKVELYANRKKYYDEAKKDFNEAWGDRKNELYVVYERAKKDYYHLKVCLWKQTWMKMKENTLEENLHQSNSESVNRLENPLSAQVSAESSVILEKYYTRFKAQGMFSGNGFPSSVQEQSTTVSSTDDMTVVPMDVDLDDEVSGDQDDDFETWIANMMKAVEANKKHPIEKKPVPEDVPEYYQKTALAQPLLDKSKDKSLLGLQYVVEVRRGKRATVDACQFICVICKKMLNHKTLVPHILSLPHKLKFSEIHCTDICMKYNSLTSDKWTTALLKGFNTALAQVEANMGRQNIAVASEKEKTSVLTAIRKKIRSVKSREPEESAEIQAKTEEQTKAEEQADQETLKKVAAFKEAERLLKTGHRNLQVSYGYEITHVRIYEDTGKETVEMVTSRPILPYRSVGV